MCEPFDDGQHQAALGLLTYQANLVLLKAMWSTCRSRGISSPCLVLEGLERASGGCILLPGLYQIVTSYWCR